MAEGRRQRTEDRGQMAEDRGQMTEDRGQMAEDRWQKTDGRRQRTEGRRQKTHDRKPTMGESNKVSGVPPRLPGYGGRAGASAAVGLKSGQSDRKRNYVSYDLHGTRLKAQEAHYKFLNRRVIPRYRGRKHAI